MAANNEIIYFEPSLEEAVFIGGGDCEYTAHPGLRHRLGFRRRLWGQLSRNFLMLLMQSCKGSNGSEIEATLICFFQWDRLCVKPSCSDTWYLAKGNTPLGYLRRPKICYVRSTKSACSCQRQIINISSMTNFKPAELRHNSRLLCTWIHPYTYASLTHYSGLFGVFWMASRFFEQLKKLAQRILASMRQDFFYAARRGNDRRKFHSFANC